jgi:hypothetical protein
MDQQPPPDFGPSLPRISKRLKHIIKARFVLLGCYLLLTGAWYYVFLSSADPLSLSFGGGGNRVGPLQFLLFTLILFGAQCLLLLGAPHVRWPQPRRKKSMFISLLAGSAIALLLSAGILFAGHSLYQLIWTPDSFRDSTIIIGPPATGPATRASTAPTMVATVASTSGSDIPWTLIAIAAVGWIFWFLIFALLGSTQWSKRFRWMYRTLIAGTILELLITIPIDAYVRKRTNCYCGEGTFWSLVIGLTAILWTFGPGVAILFYIRRHQLLADTGRCLQCGYNLHGLASNRCPECGTPFTPISGTPTA